MGLTDREKQIIEQMERALASEDPRLVATMERKRPSILLNLLVIGLGIALILAGVSVVSILVSINQGYLGMIEPGDIVLGSNMWL